MPALPAPTHASRCQWISWTISAPRITPWQTAQVASPCQHRLPGKLTARAQGAQAAGGRSLCWPGPGGHGPLAKEWLYFRTLQMEYSWIWSKSDSSWEEKWSQGKTLFSKEIKTIYFQRVNSLSLLSSCNLSEAILELSRSAWSRYSERNQTSWLAGPSGPSLLQRVCFYCYHRKKFILIRLPKEHSLTHEVCFVVILFVFKEICLL